MEPELLACYLLLMKRFNLSELRLRSIKLLNWVKKIPQPELTGSKHYLGNSFVRLATASAFNAHPTLFKYIRPYGTQKSKLPLGNAVFTLPLRNRTRSYLAQFSRGNRAAKPLNNGDC